MITDIPPRLEAAAALAATHWDPHTCSIGDLLDRVALPVGRPDAVDLWDAVVTHLGDELTVPWELRPGRTRAEVAAMLHAAAARAAGMPR
ncbi:hypothetical protein [Actinacidiphila sp. ITFR-21]|uniref:hypothetical protein n=1 Tax=Actinacidiphila sp. ITFR-21 TaxID=3075199 RepID=UPI00288B4259|nr:hypothetical protein [Streptomyces sp. ITFR-21]WNI19152.1 hypothetical protein RLT57_28855 [Streptomyces sp. ITFR-21]